MLILAIRKLTKKDIIAIQAGFEQKPQKNGDSICTIIMTYFIFARRNKQISVK